MKKYYIFIIMFLLLPVNVYAGRGCCSSHGGVCGCNSSGRQVCCDGSLSPSCGCTPPRVYGCTDSKANNYNPNANENDGSCTYTIYGCTDSNATNYNADANKDDGSCTYNNTPNETEEELKSNEDNSSYSKESIITESTDGAGNYSEPEGGLASFLSLLLGGAIACFLNKKQKK